MVKKILIVRNAYSKDFGGGERYPVNLAVELNRNELEAVIASAHKQILNLADKRNVRHLAMPWLTNQNFSSWRIIATPLYLLWQMRLFLWYIKTAKNHNFQVFHLQSRDDFIAGTLAGRLLGIRVVWTDHADLKYIFLNSNKFYKNPIGKLVYFSSRYAAKIIVVSQNELSLINKSLGTRELQNTELVYNGVTDVHIKASRNYSASVCVFALSSRLVSTKGIKEILVASKKLDDKGYDHRIILLGEGPEKQLFEKIAGKSVVFMGFPDNALSYVAGADIFVHPSYNEAFSLSLVEAAMLGLPVIATNVGGNPEIIKDKETGLLVEPKDSEKLYEAMLYAINNREKMKQYGKNLRILYESNFQFDQIVMQKIIPLYNEAHENTR